MVNEQNNHSIWGAYANKLLNNGYYEQPLVGTNNDNAHPPIHPTKMVELDTLNNPQEKNVYELIVRHFLACVSKNAIGDQTTIEAEVGQEQFTTQGLIISQRNWLDIYKWEHWNGRILPSFQVGEVYPPDSLLLRSSKTQPPPLLSESDLIGEMDRHGIGTDATIAEHIAKIQEREYVSKDTNNRFRPTLLGLALYEAYNQLGYALTEPFLRAGMEADCTRISKGEVSKDEIVTRHIHEMKSCFQRVTQEYNTILQAVAQRFSRIGDPQSNFNIQQRRISQCGNCGDMLNLCSGRRGGDGNEINHGGRKKRSRGPQSQSLTTKGGGGNLSFLHCPTCSKSLSIPYQFKEIRIHDPPFNCPLCQYQILDMVTDKDVTFKFCPSCYSSGGNNGNGRTRNNNSSDIEDIQHWRGNMKCLDCSFDSCEMSGRSQGDEVLLFFNMI